MSASELFAMEIAFDAEQYIARLQAHRALKSGIGRVSFQQVIDEFKRYTGYELSESDAKDNEDSEYLDRKHAAIIGEETAKNYFLQRINEFLREFPQYQNAQYPDYYPNISEAIFQHHFGFGPMSVWFANPTESAKVNDTQILFGVKGKDRKVLQRFSFDHVEQVKKLVRTLTARNARNQVNLTNNWTQVDMLNGTRVTIFVPPLSETYMLVFRQYPFSRFTFNAEAEAGTIPLDSVRWWELLSRLMLTMVTSGIVGSGKTTLLKVIYGAREPDLEVVTAERGTFEAHLRRDFPERAPYIGALVSSLDGLNDLFPAFLRSDAHYIVVPEIRSHEVDLLVMSKERGGGALASYHSSYVKNIPLELADLSLEVKPGRDHHTAYKRLAQSIDVVITMNKSKTGRKIVTGVYAYDYDYETDSFSVTTWMKYHVRTDSWTFHAEIPPQLKERLEDSYPFELDEFVEEFTRLAQKYPFTGQTVSRVRIGR